MREQAHVHQFKVLLLGAAPPIWRSIQEPEAYSFWDLHVALQDAMGWLDYHLHLFRATKPDTREVVQIGIPDDDAFEGDEVIQPGWEIPIAGYFTQSGVVARYEYDFGDGWEHEVTLEAILPRQAGQKYPLCVAGARACPPEDCGGVGGYEDLVTVMQTPTHAEYQSKLQWLGRRFDPEKFDPKRVRFDDPARRYEQAFEKPSRRSHRAQRTRPDNTRLQRSRARRAHRRGKR